MATPRPTISVLMPSFNQDRFLLKTLASLAKQSAPPHEVIIMDGGSKDHSRQVVDAYAPLVTTFISEPDRGQLDALTKALARATGDICYWLNCDDIAMPGAFETVANAFSADPSIDVVFSDDYAFDESARRLSVGATISNLTFWDHFYFYRQMYSECIFWRRAISPQALPPDLSIRLYTDYGFFLPLCYGRKCRWVPRRLGAFRQQPNQISQRAKVDGPAEVDRIKQRLRDLLHMSREQFAAQQRRRRTGFFLRHRLYPKLHSGLRYALRKLTFDIARKRTATFFFDHWLQPPPEVLQRLGPLADQLLRPPAKEGP
jgi:glycosyltransferase involved in cell wall biosynthesis